MASNAIDFTPVQFSTCALPERDRLPMWREEFGRQIVRVDIEPLSDDSPFRSDVTVRALPGLRTVTVSGSAVRLERTAALAADGAQAVALIVNLGRKTAVSSRGRDAVLARGDAVAVPHNDRSVITSSGWRLGVVIPHDALALRVGNLDDAAMRPIRHGNVPLRLLTGYLSQLSSCNLGEPELQRTVETHIHDLAALAIGANRDAREAGMRAVAAARLGAARAHIAACFDDAEMTVVSVARRLGVSTRYLQRLFEASGTSFTAHVTELRLQKAFAQLTDARTHAHRISDVALEAGFSDISHFNRLFRSRFGDTPSGVRAATGGRPTKGS
jgi:AraC-like DNA-binding protein